LPGTGDYIFASIDTVFAPDDVFPWGLISYWGLIVRVKIFSRLNHKNLKFSAHFWTSKIFARKRFTMGMLQS